MLHNIWKKPYIDRFHTILNCVHYFRRRLQKRRILPRINGLYRRAAIVALFGLNIASGYFAMLVTSSHHSVGCDQ